MRRQYRKILLFVVNLWGTEVDDEKKNLFCFYYAINQSIRAFKSINLNTLPVNYLNNESSWMTTKIFNDWLVQFNEKMGQQNTKILLFVVNFSGPLKLTTKSRRKEEFFCIGVSYCINLIFFIPHRNTCKIHIR